MVRVIRFNFHIVTERVGANRARRHTNRRTTVTLIRVIVKRGLHVRLRQGLNRTLAIRKVFMKVMFHTSLNTRPCHFNIFKRRSNIVLRRQHMLIRVILDRFSSPYVSFLVPDSRHP